MATNEFSPGCGCHLTRRGFLAASTGTAIVAPDLLAGSAGPGDAPATRRIKPAGPASKYTPTLRVAFVRRKESYGMLWPGAICDGAAALRNYRTQIETAAADLAIRAVVRPEPVYSPPEADAWVAEARFPKSDGLLVVLLDRQRVV